VVNRNEGSIPFTRSNLFFPSKKSFPAFLRPFKRLTANA